MEVGGAPPLARGRRCRPLGRQALAGAAAAATVALGAALSAPALLAHPPNLVDTYGTQITGKRHRWLHESRMPLVRGTVRLISAACPGHARFVGCLYPRRPRTLYLRPGARNPKGVIYHELGHAFDMTVLRHAARSRFTRLLRLRGGWFTGSGPPSELFAEAYASCARFGAKHLPLGKQSWTHSIYRYRPSQRQHRAVCRLIRRAARHAPRRPQPPPSPPVLVERQLPAAQAPVDPGNGLSLPPDYRPSIFSARLICERAPCARY